MANQIHGTGSPLPAGEWTLCLLSQDVKAASIELYLSAVRALHTEQGYPDHVTGCLLLQRVLKGIKR